MRRPGPIAWSLCLLTAPACATSAMIRTPNDLPIEARIVSSDANAIEVETEAGGAARIPRTRIVDIDHPGKALALAGLCIVALVSISTASEATPPRVPAAASLRRPPLDETLYVRSDVRATG